MVRVSVVGSTMGPGNSCGANQPLLSPLSTSSEDTTGHMPITAHVQVCICIFCICIFSIFIINQPLLSPLSSSSEDTTGHMPITAQCSCAGVCLYLQYLYLYLQYLTPAICLSLLMYRCVCISSIFICIFSI